MDIKFIKISEKGDRKIVEGIAERRLNCNPVYITGGIWIATKPLSIEGIPVKLDIETAKDILKTIGGVFPEFKILDVIRKELIKNDNNGSKYEFLNGFFVRNTGIEFAIMTGNFIDGKAIQIAYKGDKAYVYPMFWQKPSDAFYSEKEAGFDWLVIED